MARTNKPIRRSHRRRFGGGSENVHACANCGCEFTGTYCNECGQHYDTKRLTSRELWDNIAFSFVNFDKGIPNTVRRLFSHPGRMIKEYILGHRVSYSHPMALLILMCTVYGIVIGLAHASVTPEPVAAAVQEIGDAVSGLDLHIRGAGGEVTVNVPEGGGFVRALKYLFDLIRKSTIFQAVLPVPFFAWAARRLFRKYGSREYNYPEMLFACLYMASQRLMVAALIEPFIILFPDAGFLPVLKVLLYLFLAAWTFREMFGTGWRRSLWKSILMFLVGWTALGITLVAFAVALAIAVSIIAMIVSLFKKGGAEDIKEAFKFLFKG